MHSGRSCGFARHSCASGSRFDKGAVVRYIATSVLSVFLILSLQACATVGTVEPAVQQPADTSAKTSVVDNNKNEAQSSTGASDEQVESHANTAIANVAGVAVVTLVTLAAISEFIEEKVVPTALTLLIGYMLYQASRNEAAQGKN